MVSQPRRRRSNVVNTLDTLPGEGSRGLRHRQVTSREPSKPSLRGCDFACRPGTELTDGDVSRHAAVGSRRPGMKDASRARRITLRPSRPRTEADVMPHAFMAARSKGSLPRVGHVCEGDLGTLVSAGFTRVSVRSVCARYCTRTYLIEGRDRRSGCRQRKMPRLVPWSVLPGKAPAFRDLDHECCAAAPQRRNSTGRVPRSSHTAVRAPRFRTSFKLELLTTHSIHTTVQR